MDLLRLAGEHREMGRQHARQARSRRAALLRVVAARLVGRWPRRPAAVDEYAAAVRRYAPETAEMLDGMAEEFDIPAARLWAYTASGWIAERRATAADALRGEGCTAFAVAEARGGPLLAKNRDYYRDHAQVQVLAEARPARGFRWIALGSVGSAGVFSSGLNERGLAVADTHVATRDLGPGAPRFAQMLHVLERCATVAEAVALLRAAPASGGGTVLVADASGALAVCELTHERAVATPAEGQAVTTNHFVHPAVRARQRALPRIDGASRGRRARVAAALRDVRVVDAESAEALLAAHGTTRTAVCRHAYPSARGRYGTISSVVYSLRDREVRVAEGWPCQAPFVRLLAGRDFWRE